MHKTTLNYLIVYGAISLIGFLTISSPSAFSVLDNNSNYPYSKKSYGEEGSNAATLHAAEGQRLTGLYGKAHSACVGLITSSNIDQSIRCDILIQSYNLHMKKFINENLDYINAIISPLSYKSYNVTNVTVRPISYDKPTMAKHVTEEISLIDKGATINQSCIDRIPLDENISRICDIVEVNRNHHFKQVLTERNEEINRILYGDQ